MNHVAKRTEGFTLIELSLAMTFISVLLLAIAMTIIQIGTIYNKGTILKEINQSGRAVADDIQRTAAESASLNLATDYVTTTQSGAPSVVTGDASVLVPTATFGTMRERLKKMTVQIK